MILDHAAAAALAVRPGIDRLLAVLDRDGEETRIVGGAVRNALIGRPVHEIDLATTARPKDTMRRTGRAGFKTAPTGIDHGTVTVVVDGMPFEVTTLREDLDTDGRHAVVRFGRDFAADAQRRDFTINALSLARNGTVQDYTNGLADLAAGRVRFIGEPLGRIREDYLRILRFFRFQAEYGVGPIDPVGLDAAIRGREGLARLSRERIRAEFLKLLAAPHAAEMAGLLQHAGLLGRLVSSIGDGGRLARSAVAGADAAGRLAAFLIRTTRDADRLRDELRLSNAEHDRLSAYAAALARMLARPGPVDEAEARRLVVLHGREAVRDVLHATVGEPRPALTEDGRALLARFLSGSEPTPRFPLTGADFVRLGVSPGPEVGRRLAEARQAWIEAGCEDEASSACGVIAPPRSIT